MLTRMIYVNLWVLDESYKDNLIPYTLLGDNKISGFEYA